MQRVVGVTPGFEVEDHSFGVEGRAVVEGDAFTQLGRPDRQVIVGRQFGRQAGHGICRGAINSHQGFTALVQHGEGHTVSHYGGVQLHRIGVSTPHKSHRVLRAQWANGPNQHHDNKQAAH